MIVLVTISHLSWLALSVHAVNIFVRSLMNILMRKDFIVFILILVPVLLISTSTFADGVSVADAYARAVPHGQPNSAAFMVLKNSSNHERALVEARSSVSKAVELHTHKMEGGMMRMRRVEKITIKANGETVLKPGGLHVMFIGLKQQLNAGEKIGLALVFDDGQVIQLTIPVKMVAGMHKPMH
jgi:copper(I)-binding protein